MSTAASTIKPIDRYLKATRSTAHVSGSRKTCNEKRLLTPQCCAPFPAIGVTENAFFLFLDPQVLLLQPIYNIFMYSRLLEKKVKMAFPSLSCQKKKKPIKRHIGRAGCTSDT